MDKQTAKLHALEYACRTSPSDETIDSFLKRTSRIEEYLLEGNSEESIPDDITFDTKNLVKALGWTDTVMVDLVYIGVAAEVAKQMLDPAIRKKVMDCVIDTDSKE